MSSACRRSPSCSRSAVEMDTRSRSSGAVPAAIGVNSISKSSASSSSQFGKAPRPSRGPSVPSVLATVSTYAGVGRVSVRARIPNRSRDSVWMNGPKSVGLPGAVATMSYRSDSAHPGDSDDASQREAWIRDDEEITQSRVAQRQTAIGLRSTAVTCVVGRDIPPNRDDLERRRTLRRLRRLCRKRTRAEHGQTHTRADHAVPPRQ
jgi:hypothetical protein